MFLRIRSVLIFLCVTFFCLDEIQSQQINIIDSASYEKGIDCNNSIGHIFIQTDILPQYLFLQHYDEDNGSWVVDSNIFSPTVDTFRFNITECGGYQVIVYGPGGSSVDTGTYFVPCPLSYTPSQNNIKCFGETNGRIGISAYGGTPFDPDGIIDSGDEFYNYTWYKITPYGSWTDTLLYTPILDTLDDLLSAAHYMIIIEDSICVDTFTTNIFSPSALRIDTLDPLIINNVHCRGDSTGSFSFRMKGGKRFDLSTFGNYYEYSLTNNNGDMIASIDQNGSTDNTVASFGPYWMSFIDLPAGNYLLSVKDTFGCVFDSLINISQPTLYNVSIIESPNLVCLDDSTWLIIDAVTGGNSNYSGFSCLFDANSNDSLYVSIGEYTVSISDTFGCKDSTGYSLYSPYNIVVNASSDDVLCYGGNTGSVSVDTIFGGVPPYMYDWGGINPDSVSAGLYTVFVIDDTGCSYSEDVLVYEPDNISFQVNLVNPTCYGFSDGVIEIPFDSILGGVPNSPPLPPYSLYWTSPYTGSPDSLYYLSSGTYHFVIEDDRCIYYDSVTLLQPDSLYVTLDADTSLSCRGELTLINAIVTGGAGIDYVSWDTGNPADTNLQLIASAGEYTISIFDNNGCMSYSNIIITEPDSLIAVLSFDAGWCNHLGTASIDVTGGTSSYSYIWSTGDTILNIDNLNVGEYWVLVTDACGDIVTDTFSIHPYELSTIVDNYLDPNFAEVSVMSSTSGPPYSYQWYDQDMNTIIGSTDAIISDICQGLYYVVTSDANLCTDTAHVDFVFNFPLGGIVDESTTTVYPDINLWGAEPYTYLWDNGQITAHADICPGFHRVYVTDKNGCEVIGELTVDDIDLSLSPSELLIECNVQNLDVELEIIANGGTGSFSYLWNNGQTENPLNLSLFPGAYSVTVTDENGCSEDTSFYIATLSSECVPNVFSPNNDGVNDIWNLEDAFLYPETDIRIYGRYGNLVFKSIGYETPWDGKDQAGNDVEDGVYFYVINLLDNLDKIKGTVTIIR